MAAFCPCVDDFETRNAAVRRRGARRMGRKRAGFCLSRLSMRDRAGRRAARLGRRDGADRPRLG